jgi:hypothetical protein
VGSLTPTTNTATPIRHRHPDFPSSSGRGRRPDLDDRAFVSHDQTNDDLHVDANGCLTGRVAMDGYDVIVHYDDVPESDITTIKRHPL